MPKQEATKEVREKYKRLQKDKVDLEDLFDFMSVVVDSKKATRCQGYSQVDVNCATIVDLWPRRRAMARRRSGGHEGHESDEGHYFLQARLDRQRCRFMSGLRRH